MDKKKINTVPVGIHFMGRGLGELLELKAKLRRRLAFLDKNKAQISAYVYEKLHQEYQSYLDAVDGEVSVSLCDYEVKLAEIRVFSNQLELLKKSFSDSIEEIELRYKLGEYDKQEFEKLCREYKDRREHFEQSIVKYSGEQQRIHQFLDQVQVYVYGETPLERVSPEIERVEEPKAAMLVKETEQPEQEVPAIAEAQPTEQPPAEVSREQAEEVPFPEAAEAPPPETEEAPQLQTAAESQPPNLAVEHIEREKTEIERLADTDWGQEMEPARFTMEDEQETKEAQGEPDLEMDSQLSSRQEVIEESPGLQEIKEESLQADSDREAEAELPQEAEKVKEPEPQAVQEEQPAPEAGETEKLYEVMPGAGEAKPAEQAAEPAAAEVEPWETASSEAELTEEAEPSEPTAVEGGALDLDAIMSAAGATAETEPAPATVGETPVEEEQNHRQMSDSLSEETPEAPGQAVEEEEPVSEAGPGEQETEMRFEPVESEQNAEEEDKDKAVAAAEESSELPEQEQPAEDRQEIDTDQREEETRAPSEELAFSLDEKLEISLDVDQTGNESFVLSVNQTIDAIKKKTAKCPVCGTMNHAIRWYCENCDAALTAL